MLDKIKKLTKSFICNHEDNMITLQDSKTTISIIFNTTTKKYSINILDFETQIDILTKSFTNLKELKKEVIYNISNQDSIVLLKEEELNQDTLNNVIKINTIYSGPDNFKGSEILVNNKPYSYDYSVSNPDIQATIEYLSDENIKIPRFIYNKNYKENKDNTGYDFIIPVKKQNRNESIEKKIKTILNSLDSFVNTYWNITEEVSELNTYTIKIENCKHLFNTDYTYDYIYYDLIIPIYNPLDFKLNIIGLDTPMLDESDDEYLRELILENNLISEVELDKINSTEDLISILETNEIITEEEVYKSKKEFTVELNQDYIEESIHNILNDTFQDYNTYDDFKQLIDKIPDTLKFNLNMILQNIFNKHSIKTIFRTTNIVHGQFDIFNFMNDSFKTKILTITHLYALKHGIIL